MIVSAANNALFIVPLRRCGTDFSLFHTFIVSARRSLRREQLLQRCDRAVCSFRLQYAIPHRLGFQTARTNHIKLDCALHTVEEAKKAKRGEEGKNVLAFFAPLCLFRSPLSRKRYSTGSVSRSPYCTGGRATFQYMRLQSALNRRTPSKRWHSTARVSKRPTDETAACLRAQYCADSHALI